MGRTGSYYDNAAAESFFGLLKAEIGTTVWESHKAVRAGGLRFIDAEYNRTRLPKHPVRVRHPGQDQGADDARPRPAPARSVTIRCPRSRGSLRDSLLPLPDTPCGRDRPDHAPTPPHPSTRRCHQRVRLSSLTSCDEFANGTVGPPTRQRPQLAVVGGAHLDAGKGTALGVHVDDFERILEVDTFAPPPRRYRRAYRT